MRLITTILLFIATLCCFTFTILSVTLLDAMIYLSLGLLSAVATIAAIYAIERNIDRQDAARLACSHMLPSHRARYGCTVCDK